MLENFDYFSHKRPKLELNEFGSSFMNLILFNSILFNSMLEKIIMLSFKKNEKIKLSRKLS